MSESPPNRSELKLLPIGRMLEVTELLRTAVIVVDRVDTEQLAAVFTRDSAR
jgi:hypothetical protein